jgi:hypothetical protein
MASLWRGWFLPACPPLASPRPSLSESHRSLPRQILSASLFRAGAVAFFPIAMQLIPLVFAYCNGLEFWGADLSLQVVRRPALPLVTEWADCLVAGAAAVTFRVGGYEDSGAVYAAPLVLTPPRAEVIRDASQRRSRLRTGAAFLWLTVAALRGTPIEDMAARAIAACSAWRGPSTIPSGLDRSPNPGNFRSGVGGFRPLVDNPAGLPTVPSSLESARQRAIHEGHMLREALLADRGPLRNDFEAWAERITPPELAEYSPRSPGQSSGLL